MMFAVIAAVLFALALLFHITGTGIAPLLTIDTLTTAGLLCVALHLAGFGTTWRGRRWRRR
jgi:hypothetical protein